MTKSETLKAILEMKTSDVYQQLQMKLEQSSYHEIIGAQNRELTHSNFIHWFFSSNEFVIAHQSPLSLLLQLLAVRASLLEERQIGNVTTYFPNKAMYDAICFGDIKCRTVSVSRENRTKATLCDGHVDDVEFEEVK